jgi:DNA-binding response OmpR family regulator
MSPTTKILIVEDEAILAENMKSYLNRSSPNENVQIANDAYDALEALESFTPDVVLLDYGLPGLDGLQTYAKILQRKAPQASCVMITGQLTESIARRTSDFGIHHVLRKPFSFAELQDMIDMSLEELPEARVNVRTMLGRILSTRRLGLRADASPDLNWDGSATSNRRSDERRAAQGRRHDDINLSPERRRLPY